MGARRRATRAPLNERARRFVFRFLVCSVALRLGSSHLFAAFGLQSLPLCVVIALCLRGPRALAFYFFTSAPSKTDGAREAVDDGALRPPSPLSFSLFAARACLRLLLNASAYMWVFACPF